MRGRLWFPEILFCKENLYHPTTCRLGVMMHHTIGLSYAALRFGFAQSEQAARDQ